MNCSVKKIVIFVYNIVVATRQIEIDFLFEPMRIMCTNSKTIYRMTITDFIFMATMV